MSNPVYITDHPEHAPVEILNWIKTAWGGSLSIDVFCNVPAGAQVFTDKPFTARLVGGFFVPCSRPLNCWEVGCASGATRDEALLALANHLSGGDVNSTHAYPIYSWEQVPKLTHSILEP